MQQKSTPADLAFFAEASAMDNGTGERWPAPYATLFILASASACWAVLIGAGMLLLG